MSDHADIVRESLRILYSYTSDDAISPGDGRSSTHTKGRDALDRLAARLAELEAALAPFVTWMRDLAWHPNIDDESVESGDGSYGFTYADVARARAALAAPTKEDEA